jgi:hypothetical protein
VNLAPALSVIRMIVGQPHCLSALQKARRKQGQMSTFVR